MAKYNFEGINTYWWPDYSGCNMTITEKLKATYYIWFNKTLPIVKYLHDKVTIYHNRLIKYEQV